MSENYLDNIDISKEALSIFHNTNSRVTEHKLQFFKIDKKRSGKKEHKTRLIYKDDNRKIESFGYELTQLHKNLLDIILSFSEKKGRIYNISLYGIQKILNKKSLTNGNFLIKKLKEIQSTSIQMKVGDMFISFNIINNFGYDKKNRNYFIEINENYIKFSSLFFNISYKKHLEELLKLSQYTQQIITYLFTFQRGHNANIDDLINKVIGINKDNITIQAYNRIKKLILNELELNGYKFNISLYKQNLKDVSIIYKRDKDIKILTVKNIKTK